MYFPPVAKSNQRITMDLTGGNQAPDPRLRVRSRIRSRRENMQIGVYGSGYLATVISACLADFGTPVCCCHADGTRVMEVAKGNIPFFEKNLQEVIRRNVRSGRLVYSATQRNWRTRRR